MRVRRKHNPINRLIDNVNLLNELIENPTKYGSIVMLQKMKSNKYKIPTNINLLDFKIKMEKEIVRLCWKIERKLGFELPDGLK